jgi:hypothetical protein
LFSLVNGNNTKNVNKVSSYNFFSNLNYAENIRKLQNKSVISMKKVTSLKETWHTPAGNDPTLSAGRYSRHHCALADFSKLGVKNFYFSLSLLSNTM